MEWYDNQPIGRSKYPPRDPKDDPKDRSWLMSCQAWQTESLGLLSSLSHTLPHLSLKSLMPHDIYMHMAFSSMYVRRYVKGGPKRTLVAMVKHIRTALYRIIKNANWMDNATKSKAILKLDRMEALVGYPDQLRNKTLIDGYFEGNINIKAKIFIYIILT